MTSKGHPHAHFQHAVERRNIASAWAAAAALGQLSLADSLALTLLVLDREPAKFPRVALRWHARYCSERRVSLEQATAVLALLSGLQRNEPRAAGRALRAVFDADGERELANELRRWKAFAASPA